ncbi:MAG: rubredoxin [Symbiobacteriaceae bacterium]|nr:rubredoxin [Symbiobacteriaceae bacterium]
MKYICAACGWVYDEAEGHPDSGITPGTTWENVPEDFFCPLCGADRFAFTKSE